MNSKLQTFLDRTDISIRASIDLLMEHGVSRLDVSGPEPSDDFDRGANEIEAKLAANPECIVWWSNRDNLLPLSTHGQELENSSVQKHSDNVHDALRFVVERALSDSNFWFQSIRGEFGTLWDTSDLSQRQQLHAGLLNKSNLNTQNKVESIA